MPGPTKPLGVLKPLGGGDPIPLRKEEILVGRRPSCDIRLDFENVSGKHCALRFVQGVWRVRDLGSTNGTTINGHPVSHDHSVLPDDALGFASHYFSIEYDPAVAPGTLIDANQFLDIEDPDAPKRPKSLLELAGLESGETTRRRVAPAPPPPPEEDEETEFDVVDFADSVPEEFDAGSVASAPTDDDFFDMIRPDVEEPKKANRKTSS